MRAPWLLLQLADGTFPSGAFSHSGGLEATTVLGAALDLGSFLDQSLWNVGRASLPFVRAAALRPDELAAIDDACDATLPFAGPNRASRAQGRALAGAASRVWEEAGFVGAYAREGPAHHAPVFGAIFGALGVGVDETLAAYVHGAARGVLSAAVRLGLVGPLEAQRLHASRAGVMSEVLELGRDARVEDAAQAAPVIEVFAALHERLDGRMFQS